MNVNMYICFTLFIQFSKQITKLAANCSAQEIDKNSFFNDEFTVNSDLMPDMMRNTL